MMLRRMRSQLGTALMIGLILGLATVQSSMAQNGVSPTEIILGQSAAISGSGHVTGQSLSDGYLAYLQRVNSSGGVFGRKLKLITLDDGGSTAASLANTNTLINDYGVFALVGYTGQNTAVAALPIISEKAIPFLSPATGSEAVRTPFNRYVFHTRAGTDVEMEVITDHAQRLGMKRIGLLYLIDDEKKSSVTALKSVGVKHKLELVASSAINRSSTSWNAVSTPIDEVLAAQPDAIVLTTGSAKTTALAVSVVRNKGFTGWIYTVSSAGTEIARVMGGRGRGTVMTQVTPRPDNVGIATVSEYVDDLKKVNPAYTPSYASLEGYIAAKVAVEGFKRAGKALTRAGFITALESIRDFSISPGMAISFSPENHNGSQFVNVTIQNRTEDFVE